MLYVMYFLFGRSKKQQKKRTEAKFGFGLNRDEVGVSVQFRHYVNTEYDFQKASYLLHTISESSMLLQNVQKRRAT